MGIEEKLSSGRRSGSIELRIAIDVVVVFQKFLGKKPRGFDLVIIALHLPSIARRKDQNDRHHISFTKVIAEKLIEN